MAALAHRPKTNDCSVKEIPLHRKPAFTDIATTVKAVGLDLSNTVHTTKSTKQLPAVVHEVVKPSIHHVATERITREVHYHDVYHRVLPVIDLEILPTKHYVIDLENPGVLREIHEPPVKNNWSIVQDLKPTYRPNTTTNDSQSQNLLQSLHRAHNDQPPSPVLTSKTSFKTPEGFLETHYFWKHPPTLDMALFESGETVPLRMDCCPESDVPGFVGGQANSLEETRQGLPTPHDEHRRDAAQLRKTAHQSLTEKFAVQPI